MVFVASANAAMAYASGAHRATATHAMTGSSPRLARQSARTWCAMSPFQRVHCSRHAQPDDRTHLPRRAVALLLVQVRREQDGGGGEPRQRRGAEDAGVDDRVATDSVPEAAPPQTDPRGTPAASSR